MPDEIRADPPPSAKPTASLIIDQLISEGKIDENAPVTVVEYASYTCPHCADYHEGPFRKLKSEYIDTGKVRFIYREVYFDRYGLWASMVARCEPAKFFGITDLIYKSQKDWVRAGGTLIAVEGSASMLADESPFSSKSSAPEAPTKSKV